LAPVIIDCGTADAAVQRASLKRDESSALFWLNISMGLILSIAFATASSFLAGIYGEPALTNLVLVASTTFVIGAASIQHSALIRRALEFRQLAVIEVASNILGTIVAIALALAGAGYWSLVAKPLLITLLTTLGVWASCPWRPGRPRYSAGAAELVRMGLGITGFTTTDYLSQSADRLALGYVSGTQAVGNFQNAFLIYSNLLALTAPLHNIAVSSLSRLRGNLDELKQAWSRALSTLTFASGAAFATLAVNAGDIVTILLGPKWTAITPLVTVFAIRGIPHVAERTMGWLHIAAGRSDRWMRWGLISAVCQLLALAAGLPFGAIGVAVSYTITMYALVVPTLVYAGRPLSIGLKDVLGTIAPQVVSALATVLIGCFAERLLFDGMPL
ncbi:MAG: oligosaccharide flippase family protein, partial [Proteobacteria bacterium]|nr:oligosaccharide flippase family protein [Pseudomonadota bacterium]